MAFKTHISNATGNQPGQVSTLMSAGMSEGVHDLVRGDFLVSGTAGLSVNVAKGEAFVNYDSYVYGSMDQRMFSVSSSGTEAVAIASNSSGNPRIDIICIKVDTAASPGVQGVGALSIVAVAGTPAASPAVPATPDNYLKIAEVAVANGASVTTGVVTDKRVQASFGMVTGPSGYLINGKLSVTVSSNDLVVAIKTLGGNDPSAGEPVWCRIGDNLVKISAALSVTAADGTNWCNSGAAYLGTKEVDYFAYLGYNATDGVTIGFSRVPYAQRYADFSATSTSDFFCKISTITNAAASDAYENIGRFAATLSLSGTSHLWTVPTFTPTNLINHPITTTRTLDFGLDETGWSGTPTSTLKYKLKDQEVFVNASVSGTSDATGKSINLPFTNVRFFQVVGYQAFGGDFQGTVSMQAASRALSWARVLTTNGNADSTLYEASGASSGSVTVYSNVWFSII